MKKIILLAAFLLSLAPASAEMLNGEVATNYSKVEDGWTYITSAAEFMKLVQDCQNSDVSHPKQIRLVCDIEYPDVLYLNNEKYYIKYFNGIFDGMGCSITFNMKTSSSDQVDVAFIQELEGSNSEVRNLRFTNCKVTSQCSTAAVVVNKVTATEASIHDIYVDGGELTGSGGVTAMGGLVRLINENTTIDHCGVHGLKIRWLGPTGMAAVSTPVGIFGDELPAGASDSGCRVSNCYMSLTPDNISTVVKFSCLTNYKDLSSGALNVKLKKNINCFYSDNCNFSGTSTDNFVHLEQISNTNLISGNNVLNNDEWVYKEGQAPLPIGLYYWRPSETYELIVGICNGEYLNGKVTPVDYTRYIDQAQLKLTRIDNSGFYAYSIYDNITNEINVASPITVLGANIFKGISMTVLRLPGGVTEVEGSTFPHNVKWEFETNGNWHYEGNLLYLKTSDIKRLMTVVGNNDQLTINCRYCTSILDEALKGQTNLKKLYVNTWFPVDATTCDPVELLGANVFDGCPSDMDVYIKDGTDVSDETGGYIDVGAPKSQAIIGSTFEEGYKNIGIQNGWGQKFYNEYEDENNHLHQYFPVTRNASGLSTLVLGFPVKLPSDCRAWIATGVETDTPDGVDKLMLRSVGRIVPARLPVLLSYDKTITGTMYLTPYEGTVPHAATSYEGSLLRGSLIPQGQKINASEMLSNILTLSRPKGDTGFENVGFYRFNPADGIMPSFVAYISNRDVPAHSSSSTAKLSLAFGGDYDFGIASGITDVTVRQAATSGAAYNLSGQRVGSNYRGIVIKNGHKYIVK